jgi:hypothetical protein
MQMEGKKKKERADVPVPCCSCSQAPKIEPKSWQQIRSPPAFHRPGPDAQPSSPCSCSWSRAASSGVCCIICILTTKTSCVQAPASSCCNLGAAPSGSGRGSLSEHLGRALAVLPAQQLQPACQRPQRRFVPFQLVQPPCKTRQLWSTDTAPNHSISISIRIRYFDTPILLRYRIGKVSENKGRKINKINPDTYSIHFDTSSILYGP